MSGGPADRTLDALPELTRLGPRQQMAIDCVRCGRRLGTNGRVLGEVRYQGFVFQLWVCVPECPPGAGGT
nr:hypothetical protein OH820_21420 [Streptomyces sp. NBC_00857]